MPYNLIDLPSITFSSGATASPAIGGFDDADIIGIAISTATTTALTIQVEPTSTGTTFRDLRNPSSTSATAGGFVVGSSEYVTIEVGFRQLRLTSTGAVNVNSTSGVIKRVPV
jgi:hypothetical protein